MHQDNKNQISTPSLIVNLYGHWQKQQVPSIFYLYFLTALPKQTPQQQIALIQNEIQLLKHHTDHYTKITSLIKARQSSLTIIKNNIHNVRIPEEFNHAASDPNFITVEDDIEQDGFRKIYQTKALERKETRVLAILMTHLRLYRKITHQLVMQIYSWQFQLYTLGYEGPIQFIHNQQDYLQAILYDTQEITEEYSFLFERNTFLIIKREHEHSEFALIERNTRLQHEFSIQVIQALNVISKHEAYIEKTRIQGNFKQLGSRKIIQKSLGFHKIYCNYNKGHDFVLIKDPYLKSDKLPSYPSMQKYQSRKILINPEFVPYNYVEKRHPIYMKQSHKDLAKDEVKAVKMRHKEALVISPKLDKQLNDGKVDRSKLAMYNGLINSIKYKKRPSKLQPLIHVLTEKDPKRQVKIPLKQQQKTKESQQQKVPQILFHYEENISQQGILSYLQLTFKGIQTELHQLQDISKRIIAQRQYVALMKVRGGGGAVVGVVLMRWVNNRQVCVGKMVQVLLVYNWGVVNLKELLVEQFRSKGYNAIRYNDKMWHYQSKVERMYMQGLTVEYAISRQCGPEEIKYCIKSNQQLRECKLLKYHTYSPSTKYHQYCEHHSTHCQLTYYFEQLYRITVNGQRFIRAKCDKVSQNNHCYRVQTYINKMDLLIGSQLTAILNYAQKQRDQYYIGQNNDKKIQYDYVCFPEIKVMKKYLNSQQKWVLSECLTINNRISEILSIDMQRNQIPNYLVLQKPFFIGFMCNGKEEFGKILSILSYN